MLNPSTANAVVNDPTINKCVGFATRNGCGAISVVNLWDYRATNPIDLKRAGYPNSPNNDAIIRREAGRHSFAVCAWGRNAVRQGARVAEVLEILESQNCTPMAFKLSADGTPWHPLYVPYSAVLQPLPY